MYNSSLVIAIKHNGKILRENKDMVLIPFGSEFSVLVKNLNNKRVKFTLSIDGADALDGTSLIVNANSEIEVKRFIRSGNMNEGNAFKFIERTTAIEDGPRGIKIDDGIVRIEFWYEQEQPVVAYTKSILRHHDFGPTFGQPYYASNPGPACSIDAARAYDQLARPSTTCSADTLLRFIAESTSHVIVMRLVGQVGETEVVAPVTVDHKPTCSTCGRVNKAKSAYCSACGTALTLL
jgi:hypothetical protein